MRGRRTAALKEEIRLVCGMLWYVFPWCFGKEWWWCGEVVADVDGCGRIGLMNGMER